MLAQKLKQGDTIGVIAPNKALKSTDKVYLENATRYFESLGLKVKYGKYLYSDDEYCAGTPLQRATDLNNMFSDKEVKAIFTVKGGEMANGILPYIDFENIKNNRYDIVKELRKINTGIPVVKTNDFGHIHGNSIIPIGANVKISKEGIALGDYLK